MAGQIAVHALPHDEKSLAVSNESLADLRGMLDNDDAVDDLARKALEQLEAQHADDAGNREEAERRLHAVRIALEVSGEERRRKQEAESKRRWWRKPASVEVDAAAQKAITRRVVRETLPRLIDGIRQVCERALSPEPPMPAISPPRFSDRVCEPERTRDNHHMGR